jgi:cobalamin transport system substrate-binding protein
MKKVLITCVLFVIGGACHAMPLHAQGTGNITVRDDAGRGISILVPVRRVVTLAPSNTQLVSALGMTTTVVGASNTDDSPLPGTVKRIGFVNPSMEEIASLRPDLVMGIYGQDMLCDRLERLGIPCVIMAPHTMDGVMHDIELAGRFFSLNALASGIVNKIKQQMDLIGSKLRHCKTTPLVYFEIDASDPSRPFSVGKGSFIDSLIILSHAVNMAHGTGTLWPQLSEEYILAKDPDIIILSDGLDINALRKRQGWSEIKAVKNERVYTIDADLVSRPGPYSINAFIRIAQYIHPEEFAK